MGRGWEKERLQLWYTQVSWRIEGRKLKCHSITTDSLVLKTLLSLGICLLFVSDTLLFAFICLPSFTSSYLSPLGLPFYACYFFQSFPSTSSASIINSFSCLLHTPWADLPRGLVVVVEGRVQYCVKLVKLRKVTALDQTKPGPFIQTNTGTYHNIQLYICLYWSPFGKLAAMSLSLLISSKRINIDGAGRCHG